jgi:LPS-assembly lipoprotein
MMLRLRTLLGLAMLAMALGGCGFQLRSSQNFAFRSIAITPEQGGTVAADLARHFGDALVPLAPGATGRLPDVVVDVLSEAREKTVVGVNASGQVREFQLRIRVKFRMRTPQGRELIAPTEITRQSDISFNESVVLAKEAEESLLYRDMQADIVQQLLRRLAAVKTLPAP